MSDKILVIITSGKENREKAIVGLNFALHTTIDTKLILFGASEQLATEDDEVKGFIKQLIEKKIMPTACVGIADRNNIKEKLIEMKIDLKPVGSVISDYVKEGYAPITF